MKILSESERGWLAGIIDGEGSIQIKQSGTKSPHICVKVPNTSLAMILKIKELLGFGFIVPVPQKGNRKIQYEWSISDRPQIKDFLKVIMPYLVAKTRHAQVMLEFIDLGSFLGYEIPDAIYTKRLILFDEMKELNHRGL